MKGRGVLASNNAGLFNITVFNIQVYAPISNAEAAEVEQFYEDLQDLLELTPKKDAPLQYSWASLVAQLVKNLPAMQETQVQSLGQEDILEKGMATHSNILAWKIPWTEELGGLQSTGSQRVIHK